MLLQAQWYIFDKVKTEGFTGNEYARLRCDILVPKTMIGRIIGSYKIDLLYVLMI